MHLWGSHVEVGQKIWFGGTDYDIITSLEKFEKHVCTSLYTHTHTHTHIYIYIYVCVYVNISYENLSYL